MLTFSGRPTRAILIIGMCLYSQADSAKPCICSENHTRCSVGSAVLSQEYDDVADSVKQCSLFLQFTWIFHQTEAVKAYYHMDYVLKPSLR